MNTKIDSKIVTIIGISIFAGLAAFFGYWQYQQAAGLVQEKSQLWTKIGELNSSVEGWKSAHHEKELLIQGLIEEKNALYSDNSNLQNKLSTAENNERAWHDQYNDLSAQLGVTQAQKSQLEYEKQQKELQELQKQREFFQQTSEVVFYRQLSYHDYKNNQQYSFYWNIPFQYYYQYRGTPDGHCGAYVGDAKTMICEQFALDTWRDLKPLADLLRKQSGADDELFANLVLQVTHEFFYKITENTKYPIESFVEGSGDCDTLAVFAASLMKAGGLDTIVVLGYAKGSPETDQGVGHSMVGVYLGEQPKDHPRATIWSYDYEGKKYFVAEATWSDVFKSPWNYDIIGSAVGDSPWSEFKVTNVVKTSD